MDKYTNMVNAGTSQLKLLTALQDAASVAGLLITTVLWLLMHLKISLHLQCLIWAAAWRMGGKRHGRHDVA